MAIFEPEGERGVHGGDGPVIEQLAHPHPLVVLSQSYHPSLAAPEPTELLELSL